MNIKYTHSSYDNRVRDTDIFDCISFIFKLEIETNILTNRYLHQLAAVSVIPEKDKVLVQVFPNVSIDCVATLCIYKYKNHSYDKI